MKKIFTQLFIVFAFYATGYSQIPNPSFETWTTYPSGEYPTFWTTSDSTYLSLGGGHSAVREVTDVCNLINSVKLTSVTVFTSVGPGVATNGKITGLSTVAGGSPFTARPLQFTGCLKYIPSGADSGRVSALLSRWNGSARDTIALAYTNLHSVPTLTNFSYNFVYRNFVNLPDTILIVLSSGQGVGATVAGSTLTVDNLSTTGVLNVNDHSIVRSVNLFPQPAQNELSISIDLNQNSALTYEVADITGRKILSGKLESSSARIDISSLTLGNYFIALRNESGAVLYTSRFSVVK